MGMSIDLLEIYGMSVLIYSYYVNNGFVFQVFSYLYLQ